MAHIKRSRHILILDLILFLHLHVLLVSLFIRKVKKDGRWSYSFESNNKLCHFFKMTFIVENNHQICLKYPKYCVCFCMDKNCIPSAKVDYFHKKNLWLKEYFLGLMYWNCRSYLTHIAPRNEVPSVYEIQYCAQKFGWFSPIFTWEVKK